MPASGAQGAVMDCSLLDHMGGPDRHIPDRDAAGGAATRSGCAEPSRQEAQRQVCRALDGQGFTSGLQGATAASVSARRTYSPLALYGALACCVPERRAGEARRYWLVWPQGGGHASGFGRVGLIGISTAAVDFTTVVLSVAATSATPYGRKCSSDFVRRAPQVAERKVLDGHRRQPGGCPQGEQLVSGGRRWRPVFRLGGRREARPGSEKPVKAEPMKDEIRLSGKKPRENSPDEG